MSRTIELISGDEHRFSGYLAEPSGTPRGCVVVIQEIFGVNSHIRAVTDGFAAHGFRALSPALFDRVERGVELGYDEAGVTRGRDLVAKLGFDNALRDIAAAARFLRPSGKVGAVGYCWGGTAALLCATRMKMPAVSYYGGRSMPFLHERPAAPLLLHFGERDPIIPAEHVAKICAAFPEARVHVYPAGHGFNCTERGDYDATCAALAMERTLEFFHRELTG